MKKKTIVDKTKQLLPLAILFVGSWFTVKSLFLSGFFPMHDDTQVARVFVMMEALGDGQFPVRWVNGLGYGYGYPLFNFYSPLAYYFGGFLLLLGKLWGLGINALVATKIMIGFGLLMAGFGMYFLANEFFGKFGGLLSAFLYLYAPYHAVQVFVRGAVAELWAYALLPFVFLAIFMVLTTQKSKWIIFGGFSYAAIILSHNITGLLVTGFLVICIVGFVLYSKFQKKKYLILSTRCLPAHAGLLLVLLGLALSSFFWIPALSEVHLTKALRLKDEVSFRDHFVFIDQLWNSPWGFAGSAPGRADGMSFKLGKLHILLGMMGLVGLFGKSGRFKKLGVLLIGLLAASIFMMLSVSQAVWELITPLQFVQFPWRFLVFTTFGLSVAAGGVFALLDKPGKLGKLGKLGMLVMFGGLVIALNVKYFKPQAVLPLDSFSYTEFEKLRWNASKISDEYLPKDFPVPQDITDLPREKISVPSGIIVENIEVKSNFVRFETTAQRERLGIAQVAHFAGWQVYIDGDYTPVVVSEGKIGFAIPTGHHTVDVVFKNTTVRTIANSISIMTIAGLILFLIYEKRKAIN